MTSYLFGNILITKNLVFLFQVDRALNAHFYKLANLYFLLKLHTAEKRQVRLRVVLFLLPLLFSTRLLAIDITSYMEAQLIKNVSTTWQTVSLDNTYSDAIVVCTYNLEDFSASNPAAATRIRNITASSFDLRIQGWEDGPATANDVHCLIVDEGAHTLPDGRSIEAHKVVSDQTNGQFSTDGAWDLTLMEDVSASIVHTYTNPVVLGQVMSFNDNRASVIFVTDCDARQNNPFQSGQADGICVGKHIGQIASSRNPETIGYIVAESGSGTVNNVFYELALGADAIGGSANVPDSYALATDHTIAVLTQSSEDGGNGSWAVLFGNDPLPNGTMLLQVDEETVVSDMTRRHTNESVYYWAFAAAEITLEKQVVNDNNGTLTTADFELTATGVDTVSGFHGDDVITKQPVHPGVYVLSEIGQPGYSASDWQCVGATVTGGDTITLASGDNAVCRIFNNDDPTAILTLAKQVVNDNGGGATDADFTLSFDDGAGTSASGVSGNAAITSVVVPIGNYTLAENSIAGYSLASIRCDGNDSDGSDGLSLIAGETVTCLFVNEDQGVDLQVIKSVDNPAPNIGDTLTFTLSVSNAGPDTATNLSISDVLPAGFSYVNASITGGSSSDDSSPAGSGLVWAVSSLAPGNTETLTFQATVLAP